MWPLIDHIQAAAAAATTAVMLAVQKARAMTGGAAGIGRPDDLDKSFAHSVYVSSIFGEWILSEARLRPRSTLTVAHCIGAIRDATCAVY